MLWIRPEDYAIGMTFIEGMIARDILDRLTPRAKRALFTDVGNQVGQLHQAGIAHGDLTTSNIIIDSNARAHLVDFGMSVRTPEIEDMGVDIHLLERSIATSHAVDSKVFVRTFSTGYARAAGRMQTLSVLAKAATIARRGRYFAMR